MAFPWLLESGFEAGSNAEWTAETDTGSQLDFPHASELARFPWPTHAPYRGAYCARFRLGANTTDAYLTSTSIDIADAGTAYFRWYIQFCPDFAFTADDVVSLFKLRQAGGGTVEYTVGINCVAATGAITIGGSDGTAAAAFGAQRLQLGVWHCVEVLATVSTSDVGVITVWLDGVQQTTATETDQGAAVGDGDLGITNRLATTTGTVLMDEFVMDDGRVFPYADRFPENLLLTKSGTAFIGAGVIDNASLLSGAGTDNVLRVFDTAWANTNDAAKIVMELKNTANNELVDPAGTPVPVTRGAYVQLTGTNPRALVKISHAAGYGSASVLRQAARGAARAVTEG